MRNRILAAATALLPVWSFSCSGGPDSVVFEFEERIISIVLVGANRSTGSINVIPSTDDESPQVVSISAGFGDADKIDETARVSLREGRLTVDLREVEEKLERNVRFLISARTPQSIEVVGVDQIRLSPDQADPIEFLRLEGTNMVVGRSVRAHERDLRIEVIDSSLSSAEFWMRNLTVSAERSSLDLRGLSRTLDMTVVDSLQVRGGPGAEESMGLDSTGSEIRQVCSTGALAIRARLGSVVEWRPRCSPTSIEFEIDETSQLLEAEY